MPCYVSRTGFGGELGFELFCEPKDALDLWDVAVSRMSAQPFGVGVLESLRVEAGMIVLEYDYEPHERTPYDLSLDKLVALGSADFLGKQALLGIAGDPPRRLKTLKLESEELPEYGVEVTSDGEPVRLLTSPAPSPRFGPIAMAILDSSVAGDGTHVDVALGERTIAATVAPLAIYDPEKKRPRM